jgi:DNA modification methylase
MATNTVFSPIPPLHQTDWNFSSSDKTESVHGIHPYPAKFIPEIPATLIDHLNPAEGTTIFDPFCGSGTTLVAAQSRGYKSIGIDLNPIACLISRVKTTPLPDCFLEVARNCVAQAESDSSTQIPEIPNLAHWFTVGSQLGIGRLIRAIDRSVGILNDALRLALSSIIVRVSNQDSDTRYASVSRNIVKEQVYSQFLASCKRLAQIISAGLPLKPAADVRERNVLSVTPSEIDSPVGMMITSPPYPNAYEYWLYHKYRMWWLGFDPLAVKEQEIGARAHYFKKNPPTTQDFKAQMTSVLSLSHDVLIPGGYACVVIGRSRVHGKEIDNAALVDQAAEEVGLKVITRMNREIAVGRKSFNLSHARIKTEAILVYGKP